MPVDGAVSDTPSSHWHTTTMILSVRPNGSTAYVVIDGATTKDIFEAYIEQILLPTLKAGDIVVLDNLSSHKSCKVSEMIESVGAQLWYLPAYSPDLNPIEKMWSKVKSILRTLKARTKGYVARLDFIIMSLRTHSSNAGVTGVKKGHCQYCKLLRTKLGCEYLCRKLDTEKQLQALEEKRLCIIPMPWRNDGSHPSGFHS